MTNEEKIKSLSRKELAALLIQKNFEEDIDYDYDENPYLWGYFTTYVTSDGQEFHEDNYDYALEYECWWLAQDAVACCREKLD